MSEPIGPGWVEAIYDPWNAWAPAKGSVWECTAVVPDFTAGCIWCDGTSALVLKGLPIWRGGGWCPGAFRPIRSDITSIERLLTVPAPKMPVPA